jgi:hypothetical protein
MVMTNQRAFGGLLHRATHRISGVPAHAERPAGHQGAAAHGRPQPGKPGWNHSPARPPRFMRAWQRRIAGLFGRER